LLITKKLLTLLGELLAGLDKKLISMLLVDGTILLLMDLALMLAFKKLIMEVGIIVVADGEIIMEVGEIQEVNSLLNSLLSSLNKVVGDNRVEVTQEVGDSKVEEQLAGANKAEMDRLVGVSKAVMEVIVVGASQEDGDLFDENSLR
jgi:hypothetical protein